MATLPKSRQTQTVFSHSLSAGSTLNIDTQVSKPNVITSRHRDDIVNAINQSVKDKMVKDPNIVIDRNPTTGEREYDIDQAAFMGTVEDTALGISEAYNQVDALSNLCLTIDVIISSVLSPNDMTSTELIYANNSTLFGDLAPVLTQYIEDYFDNEYRIKEKIEPWLRKSLMMEGATPLVVIPESSIDDAINSNDYITQESLKTDFQANGTPINMGHLRTPRYIKHGDKKVSNTSNFSFESFSADADVSYEGRVGANIAAAAKWNTHVSVTDNPNVLKIPHINKKIRADRMAKVYSKNTFGFESLKRNKGMPIDPYRDRTFNSKQVVTLRALADLDKETVGHPVVFEFPTEAVIPIYSPSDPSEHVCYFVAVDSNGNPIRISQNSDHYRSVQRNFNSAVNGSAASSLMATANTMGMTFEEGDMKGADGMAKIYSQVIEHDLRERLDSGGFHGSDLKLGKANELYRLMFVRALAQMDTQLVFIPKELMTYIAFDYKNNGVGRSLLDKTKVLGSLRMVEMMTSAIANTKSSIDHRVVNIQIDGDDPDPMKRVNQFLHEFQRATRAAFPMGVNSFSDISDYLQRAGTQVKVTGHEGMPDMSMEVNNQRMDYNHPDETYREKLDKDHIMALGAPPESVRSAEDVEFAANIISGNAYFAKISRNRQEIFAPQVSDHIRKYTVNSRPLITGLTKIISENRDKLTIKDKAYSDAAFAEVFANNIEVSLPKPDMAQNAQQLEAFEKYVAILEVALPAFVSEELFSDINLGEKIGPAMDHIVSILKSYFMRRWLTDNNVLPELFDLINVTLDESDKFEFLLDHTKRLDEIAPAVRKYMIQSIARGQYSDGVIEKAEELTGAEDNEYGDAGGSSDYDNGGEGEGEEGDEEGGDDDFGDFGDEGGEEGDDDGDDDFGDL